MDLAFGNRDPPGVILPHLSYLKEGSIYCCFTCIGLSVIYYVKEMLSVVTWIRYSAVGDKFS